MNTELRKRLEEAADDYADKHGFRIPYDGSNNFYDETDVKASKDGFLSGAEQGYKEAIKVAKEWLKNTKHFYQGGSEKYPEVVSMYDTIEEMVADFETDMNKLLEEKK